MSETVVRAEVGRLAALPRASKDGRQKYGQSKAVGARNESVELTQCEERTSASAIDNRINLAVASILLEFRGWSSEYWLPPQSLMLIVDLVLGNVNLRRVPRILI